jgi:hypothetical protein
MLLYAVVAWFLGFGILATVVFFAMGVTLTLDWIRGR